MDVVIVSHGSPSDPDPQEAFIRDLAARVTDVSGHQVRGATLAKKGALAAAVRGLETPLIMPHFMADGWFVSTHLQRRLQQTGLKRWHMAAPFGLNRALPAMAIQHLRAALKRHEMAPGTPALIIAAHGSPSDPRPARATYSFARAVEASDLFRGVRVGFVDEDPSLEDAARVRAPAILLPFFAARAGHVLMDLPDALAAARFEGPVLDPIGTWDAVPALIAKSLDAETNRRAA